MHMLVGMLERVIGRVLCSQAVNKMGDIASSSDILTHGDSSRHLLTTHR